MCAVLYLFNASLSSEKEHIFVTLTNDEIRRIVDAVHFRGVSCKNFRKTNSNMSSVLKLDNELSFDL